MPHNGKHPSPTKDAPDTPYEVAIIGAGPIGLELAVAFKEAGLHYLHLEAKQIGYSISWWPRHTNFFSTSERIAIAGVPIQNTHQGRVTGEDYLAYLRGIVEQFDLPVNTYEPVTKLSRDEDGFILKTDSLAGPRTYRAQRVVLAKGDMDAPNRLHLPGEDLPHVSHYFTDPHIYFRRRVLIIGGRNSAVEAALRSWRAGAQVSLSYRQATFSQRVKDHIRPDVLAQIENGNIGFYPETVPVKIEPTQVILQKTTSEETFTHPTDFVLFCTGFQADMSLFEQAGVTLTGPTRVPTFNPETMETDVPGLYLAGTTTAGERQYRYRVFIENSHHHVVKIAQAILGERPKRLGTIPARNYDLALKHIEAN